MNDLIPGRVHLLFSVGLENPVQRFLDRSLAASVIAFRSSSKKASGHLRGV